MSKKSWSKRALKIFIVDQLAAGRRLEEIDPPEGANKRTLKRARADALVDLKSAPRIPRGVVREMAIRVYRDALELGSLGHANTALKLLIDLDGLKDLDDRAYDDARASGRRKIESREDLFFEISDLIYQMRIGAISKGVASAAVFGAQALLKGGAFPASLEEGEIMNRLSEIATVESEAEALRLTNELSEDLASYDSISIH